MLVTNLKPERMNGVLVITQIIIHDNKKDIKNYGKMSKRIFDLKNRNIPVDIIDIKPALMSSIPDDAIQNQEFMLYKQAFMM